MGIIERIINALITAGKWIALTTMTIMMLFTTYAVISRNFGKPVVGDVEIMQLGMIVLIMFALAFTQKEGAHISIGLLVDRLPEKVQLLFDVVSYFCTFIICIIIGWVTLNISLKSMSGNVKTTDLLGIPHYPFRFIIAFGFTLWGLEALMKSIKSVRAFAARRGV